MPTPKINKTNKLSNPECIAAKPKSKLYRLRDGGGLSLDIMRSGVKVWRYAYRLNGKQKTFTIGKYPKVGLAVARSSRDTAKEQVHAGIDPSQQKQISKRQIAANSFQGIAAAWLAQMKGEWSDTHYKRTSRYLSKDVYPIMGNRMISEIEAPEIIPVIMAVSNRGAVEAQLSHKLKSAVEGAYNHADYLDERRDMLNHWGNYLESLKQGADVVPIHRKA